jgi:hypothetical protein
MKRKVSYMYIQMESHNEHLNMASSRDLRIRDRNERQHYHCVCSTVSFFGGGVTKKHKTRSEMSHLEVEDKAPRQSQTISRRAARLEADVLMLKQCLESKAYSASSSSAEGNGILVWA